MPTELFKGQASESVLKMQVELPLMGKGEHVVQDYATIGLSLKAHPVSFVRPQLDMLNIRPCHHINNDSTDGQLVNVQGLLEVSVLSLSKMKRDILIWLYSKNCLKPIARRFCMQGF